jgi:hypothetical protein
MKDLNKLIMNIYPNTISQIIDDLYEQVLDEMENPGTYTKSDNDFKIKSLIEILNIHIKYNHPESKYIDILNKLKNIKL